MLRRTGQAEWNGTLKEGQGTVKMGTAFEGPYSFTSRFEDGSGTNPEEMVAAAHAACYSMALSAGLEKAGHPSKSVKTKATVQLEKGDAGFGITTIILDSEADVPGIDEGAFQEIATATKSGCPISKALAAVDIKLNATLLVTA